MLQIHPDKTPEAAGSHMQIWTKTILFGYTGIEFLVAKNCQRKTRYRVQIRCSCALEDGEMPEAKLPYVVSI